MKLVIYSDDKKAREPLEITAEKYGFDVHVATGTYRWYKDLETRTRSTLEVLKDFDKDEVVVVTDGHDVFVNNTAETFMDAYKAYYNNYVVFQSEKQIWPDPSLADACHARWFDPDGYRFPCFGMHTGPVRRLIQMYENGLERGDKGDCVLNGWTDSAPNIDPNCQWQFDDQLFAVRHYVEYRWVTIDDGCELAQSLQRPALPDVEIVIDGKDPHIRNKTKNTRPAFVHGHGDVRVKAQYERIKDMMLA